MNSSFFQFSVSNVYYVLSGIAQRWQHMTYTKRVRTLASFRHPDSVTLALRQLRTLPFKQLMTFFLLLHKMFTWMSRANFDEDPDNSACKAAMKLLRRQQ